MVKLPRMMDGTRLHPNRLSATLNLTPLSTATMILSGEQPAIELRSFIELYGPDGSIGIYRVSSITTDYGDKSKQISLEHGITTLEDDVTPAQTNITGTMRQILSTLLGYQSNTRWQLGTVEDAETHSLDVDMTNLLQSVLDAVELAPGFALSFDQTTTPWTMHFLQLSNAAGCECRIRRNMLSVSISMDEADMVTRVYHPKLPDGYMDSTTVSKWGVIGRALNADDDAEASDVASFAKRYLAERENPTTSISIDGLQLVSMTGETLDAITAGKLCRVALPDYGMTVNERVVSLYYRDLLNTPEIVTVTLSSGEKTASSRLTAIQKETERISNASRGYGRSIGALQTEAEELHSEIIRLDHEIYLRAYNEELTATNRRLSQAEIYIDGLNAEISLKASVEEVNSMEYRLSEAEIAIDGANAEIALKVSKDSVISSINVSTESVDISASKVNLSGYVTASTFNAKVASIDNLLSGSATITYMKCSAITIGGCYLNNTLSKKTVTIDGTSYNILCV